MKFARLAPAAVAVALAVSARAQEAVPSPEAEQTPAAAPPSQLEAGGLRPPEAVDTPSSQPESTEDQGVVRDLEQADEEDTGRGLEFAWLNGEVGYEVVGLHALSGDSLVDGELLAATQNGLVYGGGVGVRLFVVHLGARFRYGSFQDWALWTLDAEAALRVPLGQFEVYGALAAGYVSIGGFKTEVETAALDVGELKASGLNARLAGGLDYYLSNTFSIGANLAGELLILSRPAVSVADMPSDAEAVYASDGSSLGAAFTSMLVLGLHF